MQKICKVCVILILLAGHVLVRAGQPEPINVGKLEWSSPPLIPGLKFTWVLGSEDHTGLYAVRVVLSKGAKIPPHIHPDERNSTVLSGTLYVGFGDQFDQQALVPVQAGDVYVAPANTPHFLIAKDAEVVYQESGIGPTATRILKTP